MVIINFNYSNVVCTDERHRVDPKHLLTYHLTGLQELTGLSRQKCHDVYMAFYQGYNNSNYLPDYQKHNGTMSYIKDIIKKGEDPNKKGGPVKYWYAYLMSAAKKQNNSKAGD